MACSKTLNGLAVATYCIALLLTMTDRAEAQGLPVDMGSHLPIALWAVGTVVLGIVLAYGIAKNRQRTKFEKQLTERATKDLYKEEDKAEHRDRSAP
jgi:hypothetical protein